MVMINHFNHNCTDSLLHISSVMLISIYSLELFSSTPFSLSRYAGVQLSFYLSVCLSVCLKPFRQIHGQIFVMAMDLAKGRYFASHPPVTVLVLPEDFILIIQKIQYFTFAPHIPHIRKCMCMVGAYYDTIYKSRGSWQKSAVPRFIQCSSGFCEGSVTHIM